MATYRPYPKSDLHEILVSEGYIKEPENLMDWKSEYNVKLYGMYDTKKPWQKTIDYLQTWRFLIALNPVYGSVNIRQIHILN